MVILLSLLIARPSIAPLATPSSVQAAKKQDDFTLEDLYPDKPFTGKAARGMAWTEDGRYLAYLWNPFDVKGSDLWVYDPTTGKSRPLTSIQTMMPYDRELKEISARYDKDRKEDERRKTLSKEEQRRLILQDRQKKLDEKLKAETAKGEDRKDAEKDYAGISAFEWAHSGNELLFTYKGDIFRYQLGTDKISRLTKTTEPEFDAKYTKDDSGFYYRRGNFVFRERFNSPEIDQLNPDLPKGLQMSGYSLSPDETKMMITSNRPSGAPHPITMLTYRNRFAEVKMINDRGAADDGFPEESYLFLYDLNDDPSNPSNDGKPWQIYYWPAGKEYGSTSLAEKPWSPDSKKFAFATYKRDHKEVDVMVADVATKKTDCIYKTTKTNGTTSPSLVSPFFTPDGKIVALLEDSGYRHPWILGPSTIAASADKGASGPNAEKPATEGNGAPAPALAAAAEMVKGNYEVYPVQLTSDGKGFWAYSDKEDTTRMDLYKVSMDGSMERVSTQKGFYGRPAICEKADRLAYSFKSWSQIPELYTMVDGKETRVTDSQPDTYKSLWKLTPQAFSYQNRHGDTIHGYMYIPPGYKRSDSRPLFLYVYGGPLGNNNSVVEGSLNTFNMYMAYKYGYITATIDPRGQSGYGSAFENVNWDQPGKPQVEDLCDGVDWFERHYGIDKSKVGINGWSFGGFQTQMCMYTAPNVFTLGIAGAGPTQWQNYNSWYVGGVISRAEDADTYSLTKLAKNLKGQMLLLHGMEDNNVLFQDTVKVYRALLQADKGPQVELVLDPTGTHGLGGDINTRQRYEIYEAYLLKHWGPYKR